MTRKAGKSCQLPRIYFQDEYRGTDMREIQLTQGKVALVDDEDYEKLKCFKWCAVENGKTFYATRAITVSKKQITIWMHHEIIGFPPKGFEVDHRNGNGLWNLKNNLRHVTHRQNTQNKKNGKKKSSQYPGVCWNKQTQKWVAEIQINGKKKHLGRFINEYDASEAYRQAVNDIGEIVINN